MESTVGRSRSIRHAIARAGRGLMIPRRGRCAGARGGRSTAYSSRGVIGHHSSLTKKRHWQARRGDGRAVDSSSRRRQGRSRHRRAPSAKAIPRLGLHRLSSHGVPPPISREVHASDLDAHSMTHWSRLPPREMVPSKSRDDRENLLAARDSEILSFAIDTPAGGIPDQPLGEVSSPSLASRADHLIRLNLPFSLPPPPASRRGFFVSTTGETRLARQQSTNPLADGSIDPLPCSAPADQVLRQGPPTKGLGSSPWTSSPEAPTSC